MSRRKKNVDNIEAPNVNTKIVVENKTDNQDTIELIDLKPEDVVDNICQTYNIPKELITGEKKKLFEPSKSKTLTINKMVRKNPDKKRIGQIKANLTQKPLISSYKGSKTRKSSNFSLSFKVG